MWRSTPAPHTGAAWRILWCEAEGFIEQSRLAGQHADERSRLAAQQNDELNKQISRRLLGG